MPQVVRACFLPLLGKREEAKVRFRGCDSHGHRLLPAGGSLLTDHRRGRRTPIPGPGGGGARPTGLAGT